jgi:hypothetical protein
MEVTAIQLPPDFQALTGICKYRDAVCDHFGLALRRMNGNGSCFFYSCVYLLSKHGIQVTSDELRLQVISFFRECQQRQHGNLGERIMMDIQCEVPEALVSSSRRHNGEVPANVTSYLDASSDTGVWVAGYHWIRAVAHLYQVCLVVVIHGYPCVYAFGNTSHVQLFLYKRDVETHYDALVHRVSSEGHTAESALQAADAPSEVEVVYTTITRPPLPPAINPTAAPSDAPSEVEVVYTTDIRPAVPPAINPTAAPSAAVYVPYYYDPSSNSEGSRADELNTSPPVSQKAASSDAPSEVEVVYTTDIAVPPAISLATQLIRLRMATRPVCLEMAIEMTLKGVVDLSCFQGLSLDELHERMQFIWPFSRLHAETIQRYLQTGRYPQREQSTKRIEPPAEVCVVHSSDSEDSRAEEPNTSPMFQDQPPSASDSHNMQPPTTPVVGRPSAPRFTRSTLQPRVPATLPPTTPVVSRPSAPRLTRSTLQPRVPATLPDAAASNARQNLSSPQNSETSVGLQTLLPAQIAMAVGLEIKGSSQDACKREVFRLFTLRGHKPVQRNSRMGYLYIRCDRCRVSCAVSNNVAKGWQVTVCSPECNGPCGAAATAAELTTCDICGDAEVPKQDSVCCNAMHTFCSLCFDNSVNSLLINLDFKTKFLVSHMHWCTPVLVLLLSDASFSGRRLQSSLLFM